MKLFWNGLATPSFEVEKIEAIENGIALPKFTEATFTSITVSNQDPKENPKLNIKFTATPKSNLDQVETKLDNVFESTMENLKMPDDQLVQQQSNKRTILAAKKSKCGILNSSPATFGFSTILEASFSKAMPTFATPSTTSSASSSTSTVTQSTKPVSTPSSTIFGQAAAVKSTLSTDDRKFIYTLEAPALYQWDHSQTTITELEAGKHYQFRMERANYQTNDVVRSKIRLGFIDCAIQNRELEQLKNWTIMNEGKPIFEVDYEESSLSNLVYDISRPELNVLQVLWDPLKPISIALAINCPSADFISLIDETAGDRAVPFLFTVETVQNTIGIKFDSASCLVKYIY